MNKKKIYLLFYDQCIVNGGFFDNFEYYYIIKKAFKNCDVKYRVITDHPRSEVLSMLDDKYEGIESKVWRDIEVLPHVFKKFYRNPVLMDLIVCATNSAIYWFLEHGNIQASKAYIGLADWRDVHPKQNKYYPNSLILCDERIFNYSDDVNSKSYRKKILFDKYKNIKYDERYDNLLNLSLVERRFSPEYIKKVMHTYPGTWVAYTGHKNEKYYAWIDERQDATLVVPPVNDFMGLFHRFIYIPYKDGWDATPRLMPECIFYGKELSYYNDGRDIRSGGYYRYQDTLNDYKGLWLKEDDEIMEHIEKCLIL
jgi:hypothetical protein